MRPTIPITRYKYKEGWVDAEVIDEPIKIKGENVPFIEKVVITRHGPVVSGIETLSIHGSKDALAYCSVSRDPSTLVRGGIKLMKARCWDDFIDAGRDLDLYFMHVTYADIDGNIGSHVCCRAPRRVKGHDGQVPVPGWTGEYDWAGEYIPFGELPHALNPKKGFIVVSNNKPFEGHEYPHYLGNAWDAGFRAARITSFIETKGKMALEDLLPLHLDFTSLPGQQFVKRLERFETADPDAKLGFDMVRAWDGVLSADSTGGAVCELAMGFMLRYIFESGLEPEMVPLAMGRSFNPVLKEINEYYYCKPLILFAFLDDPGSWWVKNAGGKQAVIEQGLKRAVYFLRDNVARDPAAWQWGKISKVVFPHAFAMKKPLDLVFNPPSRPFGGNPFTACQSSSDSDKGWGTKRCVPSFRMAIDWSDVSKARCILPPGQSGHLASPHYMDMYDAWLKGEYIPMLWTREQVEAHVEGKLVLSP